MDTIYKFTSSGNTSTIFEDIESDPKSGVSFSDGGVVYKAQVESIMQKLKEAIESEIIVKEKTCLYSNLFRKK